MQIGIPLVAILAVILIVYLFTKVMGFSIRFPLLFSCGLLGLFLGLMLPRLLLPQINLFGTIVIIIFVMIALSFALTWLFAREEITANSANNVNDVNGEQLIAVVNNEENIEDQQQAADGIQLFAMEEVSVSEESENPPPVQMPVFEGEEETVILKDEESIEPLISECTDEENLLHDKKFEFANIFGDNIYVTQYVQDVQAAKKEEKQPAPTVDYNTVRPSAYTEAFLEADDILAHSKTSGPCLDETNEVPASEILSIESKDNVFTEQEEYIKDTSADISADNIKEQDIVATEEIIVHPTEKTAIEECMDGNREVRNNLINFPLAETAPCNDSVDRENDNSCETKIITFPIRFIEKSDELLQTSDNDYVAIDKNVENITESMNILQQENGSVDSKKHDYFDNETEQKQAVLEMAANENFIIENLPKTTQVDCANNEENMVVAENRPLDYISVQHCHDEDLPYQRHIPESKDKPVTARAIERELKKNLLPRQVPKSDSFDDLLDFAFVQKEKGNFDDAVVVFEMAYEMYADMDMSTLIIAELVNIYKQLGQYDDAIAILQRGLKTIAQEIIRKDFVTNIAYMRIIKNILAVNQLDLLPYDEIPDKVRGEIEKEFSAWKYSS